MIETSNIEIFSNWINKKIWYIITIFIILIILVFISYLSTFHSYNLSDSTEHWGQFGDYIGGTLNPIIAIANLLFLIYLTLLLKNRDDLSDAKSIKTQQLIALSQMRHEAYKDLQKKFNEFKELEDNFKNLSNNYFTISQYLGDFIACQTYLFNDEDYQKTINELRNCAIELGTISEEYFNKKSIDKDPIEIWNIFAKASIHDKVDPIYNRFGKAFHDFIKNKYKLITIIQRIVLDTK